MKLEETSVMGLGFVKRDGKWVIKRKTITRKFDLTFRKWEIVDQKIDYIDAIEGSDPKLYKEIEFEVLIYREAISTYDLLPLKYFGVQKLKAKVPSDKEDIYLTFNDGKIFSCEIKSNGNVVTQVLGIEDKWIQKVGEPRKVTESEALEYARKKCMLYRQLPSGEFIVQL
jgi:hypothetical protein